MCPPPPLPPTTRAPSCRVLLGRGGQADQRERGWSGGSGGFDAVASVVEGELDRSSLPPHRHRATHSAPTSPCIARRP